MGRTAITGTGYFNRITKKLAQEIPAGSIAFLSHRDLDQTAAESLVYRGVKAVVNLDCSMTGRFNHEGVAVFLNKQIPLFDVVEGSSFCPTEGPMAIAIAGSALYTGEKGIWTQATEVYRWDEPAFKRCREKAAFREAEVFTSFMENSLSHAAEGLREFIAGVHALEPLEGLEGKRVFVIARGAGYREEIRCWKSAFKEAGTVVIAVDGAAEGLIEEGIVPDVITGDMDSLPAGASGLNCRFIAHAYPDGTSPGKERLKACGISCEVRAFPGMSEDLAIMIAGVSGAAGIFTIGCRSGYQEMLEKNREGMGSTILTRAYLGTRISDLKSGSELPFLSRQSRRAARMEVLEHSRLESGRKQGGREQ
ncbi:putative cytokinetic ring protein SteA [Alteribacter natronophilus]|uniref:putative cytokinetic ring protein SteA n=1 Tax=Alteribacter natronophilus TaxID=2583810 RepID=UPI00110E5DE8|nr:putative cytokinetic ring protein SteA [Alteribacter natronophilus]TMW73737.1 hypothetical protein FGB90_05460 [Alteribacter natronophilus]